MIDYSKISQQAETPKEATEGCNAYLKGVPQNENPYPINSKQFEDWDWGWQEGENIKEYEEDYHKGEK